MFQGLQEEFQLTGFILPWPGRGDGKLAERRIDHYPLRQSAFRNVFTIGYFRPQSLHPASFP